MSNPTLDPDVMSVITAGSLSVWADMAYNNGRNVTSWVPEPATRGTFRLLISCLATLSLCVYSALHLNVSPALKRKGRSGLKDGDGQLLSQSSFSATFSRKATWVLIGMFAPEFVVYSAWSQWRTARKLTALVASSPEAKDLEWSMTHSYFALMGGFVVDTADPGEDDYIANSPRLYLTANGMAALAEIGLLPSVSRDFILDKSKADHFAKALVLIQAGWLVIQSIARAADRLPISQLELNTIAHIACAVFTYGLWWNKPLDVRQPVVLTGEWKRPLVAAMAMFSQTGRNSQPEMEAILHYRDQSPANPPVDLSAPLKLLRRRGQGKASPELQKLDIAAANDSSTTLSDAIQPKKITLHEGDVLLPFGFGPKPSSTRFRWEDIVYSQPPVRLNLDTTTLTRWSLACQSLSDYPNLWARYRSVARASERNGTLYLVQEYPESKLNVDFVRTSIPNWPNRDLLPHNQECTPMLFFSLCVIFYGGIHMAAWNDYFPSNNERLLWRIAAMYVAASGIFWLALRALQVGLAGIHDKFVRGRVGSWARTPLGAVLMMVPLYIITAVGFGYVVARVYLVAEAFISLRDVPLELYYTPAWSRYLVHF
ncbi:hypothetical protein B0T16DRAFT_492250 [Cercophora newfieldiana]|uniref:Uncharacterized protein n=1 Tax=Cercophora newfieldiana TaxID=92897 RepID=A0AA39YDT9_9PEZI|nr:hypothetical protein B0T16DRAFT_492250 [Cercophora newfieldiana]